MNIFSPYSTMKNVAQAAGEGPTSRPQTACPAAATFINSAETATSHGEHKELAQLVPEVVDSRNPDATRARLEFLADRAVRKWTPEALAAISKTGIAQAIREETSLRRAANLADEMASSLYRAQGKRARAAGDTARAAAKAVRVLDENDWTFNDLTAQNSAHALYPWSIATQKHMAREVLVTVRELLAITRAPLPLVQPPLPAGPSLL